MNQMPLLKVLGLSVNYGQLTALRDVDLDVFPGDIVFVAGPNGAGKSTLLRTIAGDLKAAAGTVRLEGWEATRATPEAIAARGFTLVPEGREIFQSLSVAENLRIGAYRCTDKGTIASDLDFVLGELPELKPFLSRPAGLLSGGQQQMLTLGRALMTRAPLIAIDEPSLGLAPKIIDRIYDVLTRLRTLRGLTLLIAEQSFTRAVQVDARLVMLRSGRVEHAGLARQLVAGGRLESSYFGEALP